MIQYRLTLDNGRTYFVLAKSFVDAVYALQLEVRCAEYFESREYVCPAVVQIEVWDTLTYAHEKRSRVLDDKTEIEAIINRLEDRKEQVWAKALDEHDEGAHMYCDEIQAVIDEAKKPGADLESIRKVAREMSINLDRGE